MLRLPTPRPGGAVVAGGRAADGSWRAVVLATTSPVAAEGLLAPNGCPPPLAADVSTGSCGPMCGPHTHVTPRSGPNTRPNGLPTTLVT